MSIFIIPRQDQSAEITGCLTEIKFNACNSCESMLSFYSMLRHQRCNSGPQLHILFFCTFWWTNHAAQQGRQTQWAPHELQALCAQDLGSLELLQTDRSRDILPRSVYWCPCCLSWRGCLLVWKQGLAFTEAIFTLWLLSTRKMKIPSNDGATVVNTRVPEREREKSDGKGVQMSKKIPRFRPSPLQRTRMIRKELVQDQEE